MDLDDTLPKPIGCERKKANTLSSEELKKLKNTLRDNIFYISHPSISDIECSINLKIFDSNFVKNILLLDSFNLAQIELNPKTKLISFKGVAALKLLNILFKDQFYHPLYPNYIRWVGNSNLLTLQ